MIVLSLIRSDYSERICQQTYALPSDFTPSKESLLTILTNVANAHIMHYKNNTFTLESGNFYATSDLEFGSEISLLSEFFELSDKKCKYFTCTLKASITVITNS